MKNIVLSRTVPSGAGFGHFSLSRLWTAMQVAKERRQLAKLDTDMLADLGLTEAAAQREAARSFWDLPSGR